MTVDRNDNDNDKEDIVRPKTFERSNQTSLAQHILPTSGAMVGVCTTLIGLVKVVEGRIGPSRVDEYAACASLLFLASATTSYLSIRHAARVELSKRLEAVADQCFLIGLLAITAIGVLFAYEAI